MQSNQNPQKFRFLAVLDFEATCDSSTRPNPQEIIEFPIVVIDTALSSFPIITEFHTYVKPVHHPALTSFCCELTGIKQKTVDEAPTFTLAWKAFNDFLQTNGLSAANTLFVTCGHWDLKTMLPNQLRTSKITDVPEIVKHWCNIKMALESHASIKINGMQHMLNHFKLPLVGRHHSGIDDARNIAAIARKLLEQNYVFRPLMEYEKGRPMNKGPLLPTVAPQKPTRASLVYPQCGPLIDIGVNLANKAFPRESLFQTLQKWKSSANITHIIITGTCLEGSQIAVDLCREFNAMNSSNELPQLYCTVGVHPHEAGRSLELPDIIKSLENLIVENRDVVVAVGECGLDFDRNFSNPEDQEKMFYDQAKLSLRLRLPLFLHERRAHTKFMEVINRVNEEASEGRKLFGVLHCYTGETVEHLNACLNAGLSVGITGWVCDERPGRGAGLASIAAKIPLDKLMVETDSPYLLPRNIKPTPKVCDPSLVGFVAAKLADLYGVDITTIAAASTANAIRLFGLKK